MFFFFNDTATTEIYTLSLHDALPICGSCGSNLGIARQYLIGFADASATIDLNGTGGITLADRSMIHAGGGYLPSRSEEHTSELQSRPHLVCRLLLEKKKILICAEQAA